MNAELAAQPVPAALAAPLPGPVPMLFACGLPRSGKTYLTQLLANAFQLTYPDNVSARFWGAPYHGVSVSRSLRGQMQWDGAVGYESVAGVTPEAFAPHEFGYFWCRFFPFGDVSYLPKDWRFERQERLAEEIRAMFRAGAALPLMFPGTALSMNADYFAALFPGAFFIDLRRDPAEVALSMLNMRRERYSDETVWWSASPPERESLESSEPERQVAGQVHFLNLHMCGAIGRIPAARRVEIDYHELCRAPSRELDRIAAAAKAGGVELNRRDAPSLPPGREPPARGEEAQRRYDRLREYLAEFSRSSDGSVTHG